MKKVLSLFFLLWMVHSASAAVKTEEVTYSAGGAKLTGFLAYDDALEGKRPGVLVVHEWWGHNEHARNRAKMLAGLGYTALAVDMYGDGKFAAHPKDAGEFMNAAFANWEASKEKFHAARKLLEGHETVDAGRIGGIGFCFGGAVLLRLSRGGEALSGVVAFHSALPGQPAVSWGQVKTPILVINGADDGFLKPEQVAAFKKDMDDAGADFNYMSLPGVRHSYTNPQADEFSNKFELPALKYDAEADKRAWQSMQEFFGRVFGK